MNNTDVNSRKISAKQLYTLTLVCMLADTVINPRTAPTAISAQGLIIGAAIETAVIATLTLPLFFMAKKINMHALLSPPRAINKIYAAAFFVIIALSAGAGIIQAESFYRFVSDNLLPIFIFAALVAAVALYGAKMGLEPLARSGLIICVLLFASIAFIYIANISRFALTNLQFSEKPVMQGISAAVKLFNFPTEIPVFFLFAPQVSDKKTLNFNKILPLFLVIYIGIAFVQELVLGSFSTMQLQPLHTLARIGSISVFTRLDAIHVSVWIMVGIFRVTVYFFAMSKLAQCFLPFKVKKYAIWVSLAALILCTVISLYSGFEQIKSLCSIFSLAVCIILPLINIKGIKEYA